VSAPAATPVFEDELRAAHERVEQLERALTTRIIVDVAVGVLLERYAVRRDDAFELLRHAARHHRRRIHELAAEVVEHRTERPEILTVLTLREAAS
jgi:AmiR/NasT family two-component response regulator